MSNNDRVLVTGSSGFFGRNMVKYLNKNGIKTVGIDIIPRSTTNEIVDISGRAMLNTLFNKYSDITSVIHFAAQPNPAKSEKDPVTDAIVNIIGTVNIIESMVRHGVSNLTMISSIAALNPLSNYGVSKLSAEQYVLKYTRRGFIDGKIARISSMYGEDRWNNGWCGPVNIFLYQGLSDKKITVFGEGRIHRDFTYIRDGVEAIRIISERGRAGHSYDVGCGRTLSIAEVAEMISWLTGQSILYVGREEEYAVDHPKSDIAPLLRLGYVPKFDTFNGIRAVYEYMSWLKVNGLLDIPPIF